MKCTKCGKDVQKDWSTCPYCGEGISKDENADVENDSKEQTVNEKTKGTNMIGIAGALISLFGIFINSPLFGLIGLVLCIFALRKKNRRRGAFKSGLIIPILGIFLALAALGSGSSDDTPNEVAESSGAIVENETQNETSTVEEQSQPETTMEETTVEQTTIEQTTVEQTTTVESKAEESFAENDEEFAEGIAHNGIYDTPDDEIKYMPEDLEFVVQSNKIQYGDIWAVRFSADQFVVEEYTPTFVRLRYTENDEYNLVEIFFDTANNPDAEYWRIGNEVSFGDLYEDDNETIDFSMVKYGDQYQTARVERIITANYTSVMYDCSFVNMPYVHEPTVILYK